VVERVLQGWLGALRIWRASAAKFALGVATLLCVTLCWIPFRAQDFGQTARITKSIIGVVGDAKVHTELDALAVPIIFGAIVVVHWFNRSRRTSEAIARLPAPVVAIAVAAALLSLFMIRSDEQAFLYFQF
jgi:hypothetical protein